MNVAFIEGTEPHLTCEDSGDQRNFLQRVLGIGERDQALPPPAANQPVPQQRRAGQPVRPYNQQQQAQQQQQRQQQQQQKAEEEEKSKKKGFFGRIVGIFK